MRWRLRTLYNEQSGFCAYCLRPMTIGSGHTPTDATLEHCQARAQGGANRMFNLVAACAECNAAKGDKPLWWAAMRQAENWRADGTLGLRRR